VKRDLVGWRTGRNLMGALCWVLEERPQGCSQAVLWRGAEACGVDRETFDLVVRLMLSAGYARRDGDRLFAGEADPRTPQHRAGLRRASTG
jgi:hypothetical protein